MPMIIKNNVRYCSTGGDAENIVYDNAESGMEATNMQDAIDELNSNFYNIHSNMDNINSDVDYLNSMLAEILEKVSFVTQKGTKIITTYSANRNYTLNITFERPFVEIPTVKASSITSYHDGGFSGYLTTTVSNITTTGFTITIDIWCAYGTNTTVTWEASGKV